MPAGEGRAGWRCTLVSPGTRPGLSFLLRTQQQSGHTIFFRCQLQAPPGNRRDFIGPADDSGDARTAQTFFHRPQNVSIAFALHENEPVGINAEFRHAMPIEIIAMLTPEDRRLRVSGYFLDQRRRKPHRRRIAKNLMQAGDRQAAPGQGTINFRITEGNSRFSLGRENTAQFTATLELANLSA